MPTHPSVWQRWLALTAGVLLAHLALMGLVSDTLAPPDQAANAEATFETRTLAEPPVPAPLTPNQIVRTRAKPPPKAPAAPIKPARQDNTVGAPSDHTEAAPVPTEPAPPAPPVAAKPPEPAASAPEVAQAPETPVEPPTQALHFNPERLSASKRLIYTLSTSKFPFSLNAELLWRNQGDSYSARLRYSAFGQSRMQTSQGRITDTGLAPERFADKYRSELATHFNRDRGTISFSANTPDAPLLAGAQDRLSVLVQLGALVASEPAHFTPGTTVTLQTAGPRNAAVWLFTVMQVETLALPGGALQGLKLERQPRDLYEQKIEVWLAPQLDYLPARIRVTEANGENADQQWRATEPDNGVD